MSTVTSTYWKESKSFLQFEFFPFLNDRIDIIFDLKKCKLIFCWLRQSFSYYRQLIFNVIRCSNIFFFFFHPLPFQFSVRILAKLIILSYWKRMNVRIYIRIDTRHILSFPYILLHYTVFYLFSENKLRHISVYLLFWMNVYPHTV